MRFLTYWLALLLFSIVSCGAPSDRSGADEDALSADLIIYGGTSAAVTAAVQAVRMDKSVIMVSPDVHLAASPPAGLAIPTRATRA